MNDRHELKLLRAPEVAGLLGIGLSTWRRWVADGEAPPPVRLSPRSVAWRYSDIAGFIKSRLAASVDAD